MHTREAPHHFQMAQFLRTDVHQQILAVRILTVQSLNRILHRGGEFAVRATELLKQHIAETNSRLVHADREHQLFDVVIHGEAPGYDMGQYASETLVPSDLDPRRVPRKTPTNVEMRLRSARIVPANDDQQRTINRIKVIRRANSSFYVMRTLRRPSPCIPR